MEIILKEDEKLDNQNSPKLEQGRKSVLRLSSKKK